MRKKDPAIAGPDADAFADGSLLPHFHGVVGIELSRPLLEVGPSVVGTADGGELGQYGFGSVVEHFEEDVGGVFLRAVEHKLDVGGHGGVVVLEPVFHVVGLVGHVGAAADVEQWEEGVDT